MYKRQDVDDAVISESFEPSAIKDAAFYDFQGGNLNYSSTQGPFEQNISVGSIFRFKEDPMGEVYTITDVDISYRLRYEDVQTGLPPGPTDGNILYNLGSTSPTSMWRDFNQDNGTGFSNTNLHVIQPKCYPLQTVAKNGGGVVFGSTSQALGMGLINGIQQGPPVTGTSNQTLGCYRTSSYLRASNFTKNYRIWLDKKLSWNPYQETVGELDGGQIIKLPLKDTTHGVNYVDVTQLNTLVGVSIGPSMRMGIDASGVAYPIDDPADPQQQPLLFEEKRRVEIGMVVENVTTDGASTTTTNSDMLPMVAKIEIGGGVGNTDRIYFKNYHGGNELTGQGISGSLYNAAGTVSDTITFKQYPANGLSKNSAKNLNYFRGGMGFGMQGSTNGDNVGTDALGYTIEFVELKEFRPDENVLPENPAIWETEPKTPETDLDIYHAVGGFNEISISDVSAFVPIGSLVTHENSNTIPPGTTIVGVSEIGEIILSEPIVIDPSAVTGGGTWGSQDA